MTSEAAALLPVRLSPFEQLRYAREVVQTGKSHAGLAGKRLNGEVCRAVDLGVSLPRERHRLRHGQGGADRSKDRRHARLDGHTGAIGSTRSTPCTATWAECRAATWRSSCRRAARRKGSCGCCRRWASLGVPVVAITARADSALGRAAAVVLSNWAPGRGLPARDWPRPGSTTAMLALGDALALVDEPDAELRPRRFRPLPSGRKPRTGSSARSSTTCGRWSSAASPRKI